MSYSKTIIEGRVGREPETRFTLSGKAICNFSVAVGEKRGGEEETTWFNVVTFEKTAEIAQQYVKKGGNVLIEGRMKSRKWEDKDGNKRESWGLVCDRLVLLGGKPEGSATPDNPRPQQKPAQQHGGGFDQTDEEIPFSHIGRGMSAYVI